MWQVPVIKTDTQTLVYVDNKSKRLWHVEVLKCVSQNMLNATSFLSYLKLYLNVNTFLVKYTLSKSHVRKVGLYHSYVMPCHCWQFNTLVATTISIVSLHCRTCLHYCVSEIICVHSKQLKMHVTWLFMHTGHARKCVKSYCLHGHQGYAEWMWAAIPSFSRPNNEDWNWEPLIGITLQ